MKRIPASLLCLAFLVAAASGQDFDPRGANKPGFSLSFGVVGVQLELLKDAEELFQSAPSEVDAARYGVGPKFEVGYAFGHDFALQLRIVGSEHATGDPNTNLNFALVELDAIAYLLSQGPLRPYVAGGLGGAGLALTQLDQADDVLTGGAIDFGGGLEVFVSRRWNVALDYRFGIQNFEREILKGAPDSERDVDLSSHSHRWGFSAGFAF